MKTRTSPSSSTSTSTTAWKDTKKNVFANTRGRKIRRNTLVAQIRKKLMLKKPTTMKELRTVSLSPNCWKCYRKFTCWTCEGCGRCFHRHCLVSPGPRDPEDPTPRSIFNMPYETVQQQRSLVDDKGVRVVECYQCLMAKTTNVPVMKKVSQESLNVICSKVVEHVDKLFKTHYFRQVTNDWQMDLVTIGRRAERGVYKTIEGFYSDVSRIFFDSTRWNGALSEETKLAKSIRQLVNDQLQAVQACVKCYRGAWDLNGKTLSKSELKKKMMETCDTPHPVFWVKAPMWGFWPAKVLRYNANAQRSEAYVQWFGDGGRGWVKRDADTENFFVFSRRNDRFMTRKKNKKLWEAAVRDAEKYLKDAQEAFGQVALPDDPVPFPGNLVDVEKWMFPQVRRQVFIIEKDTDGGVIHYLDLLFHKLALSLRQVQREPQPGPSGMTCTIKPEHEPETSARNVIQPGSSRRYSQRSKLQNEPQAERKRKRASNPEQPLRRSPRNK